MPKVTPTAGLGFIIILKEATSLAWLCAEGKTTADSKNSIVNSRARAFLITATGTAPIIRLFVKDC